MRAAFSASRPSGHGGGPGHGNSLLDRMNSDEDEDDNDDGDDDGDEEDGDDDGEDGQ